jgi:hypothetical protein
MSKFKGKKMEPRINVYSEDPLDVLREIERLTSSDAFREHIEGINFYIYRFTILDRVVGIILN